MNVSDTRELGRSGLKVTMLGFGGVPLGNLYRACSDAEAHATLRAAYDAGIRLVDTAPFYGLGMSEHRIGAIMREVPRGSWVLSTKIGRVLRAAKDPERLDEAAGPFVRWAPFDFRFDYSYDGVMRSFEDSLQRLATNRIDILLIHDCDIWTHGSEEAYRQRFKEVMGSGYKALAELRAAGDVKAIGVGVNEVPVCLDFLAAGEFDCMLLAGRYTLLEQGALDELLPKCEQANVSLIIGGPYNSGILATGAVEGATYDYKPAPPEIMDKVRRMEAVCKRHGVALPSAALQFPLGHKQVATMIPGARSVAEVEQNVRTFNAAIPADLWAELKHEGLLREDAPTP
jgi:D-threo-aldose 1-dehydrogenase